MFYPPISMLAKELIDEIKNLRKEIDRLITENWQLKGALGYPVPGDIPEGPFKCGLCEAKTIELLQLQDEVADWRECVRCAPLMDGSCQYLGFDRSHFDRCRKKYLPNIRNI